MISCLDWNKLICSHFVLVLFNTTNIQTLEVSSQTSLKSLDVCVSKESILKDADQARTFIQFGGSIMKCVVSAVPMSLHVRWLSVRPSAGSWGHFLDRTPRRTSPWNKRSSEPSGKGRDVTSPRQGSCQMNIFRKVVKPSLKQHYLLSSGIMARSSISFILRRGLRPLKWWRCSWVLPGEQPGLGGSQKRGVVPLHQQHGALPQTLKTKAEVIIWSKLAFLRLHLAVTHQNVGGVGLFVVLGDSLLSGLLKQQSQNPTP